MYHFVFAFLDEISFFLPSPFPTVYPSLESDEDDPALKSRPKKKRIQMMLHGALKVMYYLYLKLSRSGQAKKIN